jgi:SpoVK/Ycf46/Vps4 family AAA+-type ATPase
MTPTWHKTNEGWLPAQTVPILPAGVYEPAYPTMDFGWLPKEFALDEIIIPENGVHLDILGRIDSFFHAAEKYRKLKLVHKMSLLLYGTPGGGKTTVFEMVANSFIGMGGVVLCSQRASYISGALQSLRKVESERNALVLLEDVEDACESDLLSLLCGEDTVDHVFFLFTSNHPEQISDRLGRPGRIDDRIEIKTPDYDFRRLFFSKKLPEMASAGLDAYARYSDGMTFAKMRQMLILTEIHGLDLADAADKLELDPITLSDD